MFWIQKITVYYSPDQLFLNLWGNERWKDFETYILIRNCFVGRYRGVKKRKKEKKCSSLDTKGTKVSHNASVFVIAMTIYHEPF